ncbi:MAG: hypothetical protein CR959_01720 [Fusobacteriales bacterium]|nr:MAG: hypothetical protein CR959_01720 [Fusobacteriales bacterium]
MNKIYFLMKHVKDIYGSKGVLKFLIPSVLISLIPRENDIFEAATSLFTALIVVEIAFVAIFYSGSEGVKKAKEKSMVNFAGEKSSFYHYLLIKNYHSLFIKFIVLFLLFLMKIYNINLIGYNSFIFSLIIYSVLVTLDLMISMYYFLWGS